MVLEIILATALAAGLGYAFWDHLKQWAGSAFEYLLDKIWGECLVDAITGGLVTIVQLAGGFLKRTRFFQRVYAYFTQGRQTFQQYTDIEIPSSELPREIRNALEGYAELPVMRIQT